MRRLEGQCHLNIFVLFPTGLLEKGGSRPVGTIPVISGARADRMRDVRQLAPPHPAPVQRDSQVILPLL